MTMNTADYLFPRDLEVSAAPLRQILMIGSCLSEFYAEQFQRLQPGLAVEHILFNNAQSLPPKSREQLAAYDLQYIQLPLRSVLTDGVIRTPGPNQSMPDWLEVGRANLDAMLRAALGYCDSGLLTIVSNFVVPQGKLAPSLSDYDSGADMTRVVRELNYQLAEALRQYPHAYLADVDMIANTLGKKYFLDDTVYFYTHGVALSLERFLGEEAAHSAPAPSRLDGQLDQVARYPDQVDEFYQAIYRQVDALYRSVNQIDSVKLVIFDLDNTMWRGLIGEHYEPGSEWPKLHGWPTGVWDAVNQLRRRGIVVSLCSKNDEAVVAAKWKYAVPLFVEYSDFLVPQINWQPKAQNIAAILEALSLTPKNVVFVDDNPVERDSVKAAFPELRVIGADPFAIKRILTWAPQTQLPRLSAESAQREASLLGKVQRDRERAALPRGEFLRSLQTTVLLDELRDSAAPAFFRVLELVNKTNQFNTTGARRTPEDYLYHWGQGGRIFHFSVQDRYSDYGLVGVLFVMGNCITQFVMSCRVLGMEIETAVLRELAGVLRAGAGDDAVLTALVLETDKNTPSRAVYSTAGFQPTANPQLFVSAAPLPAAGGAHVQLRWP